MLVRPDQRDKATMNTAGRGVCRARTSCQQVELAVASVRYMTNWWSSGRGHGVALKTMLCAFASQDAFEAFINQNITIAPRPAKPAAAEGADKDIKAARSTLLSTQNTTVSSSELLANYCDMLMKNTSDKMTDEDMEEVLEKVSPLSVLPPLLLDASTVRHRHLGGPCSFRCGWGFRCPDEKRLNPYTKVRRHGSRKQTAQWRCTGTANPPPKKKTEESTSGVSVRIDLSSQ